MDKNAPVRMNFRTSASNNAWLDEKSKITGVSKSSLVHMYLDEHIRMEKQLESVAETALNWERGNIKRT